MVVSPAKAIDAEYIDDAKALWEQRGYEVLLAPHVAGRHYYFSGTDEERLQDFQAALNREDVRAIVCARGGYGCVRIVDQLDWSTFQDHPKWLIGFSDVTVFHQRLERDGIRSIHGTMPLNYRENSKEAIETLFEALEGRQTQIAVTPGIDSKIGKAQGILTGGNLSIIYSLLGTDEQADYRGKILLIEDLCEQLYHIDRMFFALKKAGVFDQINGIIVGGFTDLRDTKPTFGMDYKQSLLEKLLDRDIPVCFDFPSGHIDDNRALILGASISLEVGEEVTVRYLK